MFLSLLRRKELWRSGWHGKPGVGNLVGCRKWVDTVGVRVSRRKMNVDSLLLAEMWTFPRAETGISRRRRRWLYDGSNIGRWWWGQAIGMRLFPMMMMMFSIFIRKTSHWRQEMHLWILFCRIVGFTDGRFAHEQILTIVVVIVAKTSHSVTGSKGTPPGRRCNSLQKILVQILQRHIVVVIRRLGHGVRAEFLLSPLRVSFPRHLRDTPLHSFPTDSFLATHPNRITSRQEWYVHSGHNTVHVSPTPTPNNASSSKLVRVGPS